MKASRTQNSERGAVVVMVAIWLPVLALFASFAIDISHFYDYSRNLQNRADAAALAAGQEFGGTCFGGYTATQTDTIGKAAQQYSGPPNATPSPGSVPNGTNLPYPFNSATPYQNQPNLTKGTPANFHLLLNSPKNWDAGGTNWSMGSDVAHRANSTAICSSTDENGKTAAMVDVRVTQANLGLFFPLLGFTPNISAHARVQLEGAGGGSSLPLAIPDPAQTPCMRAELINDSTGAIITDGSGNPIDVAMTPPNPGGTPPQLYWTATLPQITIPAAQLSVQAYIPDDCTNPGYPTAGALFDSQLNGAGVQVATHGLDFVDTFAPLPAGDPANPAIGSVYLTPVKNCTDPTEAASQDAYFYYFPKSTSCSVTVNAQVKFPSAWNNTKVFVSMDGGNQKQMNAGAGNTYTFDFAIPSESGRHTFALSWSAPSNGNGAFNGGNPMQATYAAFSDGSDPSDDSGPVTQAFVGDTSGNSDVNAIQQGTQQTLTVKFLLQGLALSGPTDLPIVLRAAVQNRKATGAFDCGQGTGAQGLHDAIVNGCPDPVAIFNASQGCVSLPTTPLTCADLVPGNKRTQVTQAFQDRINSAVDAGTASPCDAWQSFKTGTPIPGYEPWDNTVSDPRIMFMAVTSPADLAGHGGPNNQVRILGFATFYVTGFDGDVWFPNAPGNKTIPNCPAPTNRDENYPGTGTDKDQIWGHFIKYVTSGTPNGLPCNPNDVSACVAALTR
jgi:hypothetical protein